MPKSALYLEAVPLFARGLVSLPNQQQLLRELRLLERRTHRRGRDSVDHGSGGSDDFANALCVCLRAAARPTFEPMIGTFGYGGGPITWRSLADVKPVRSWQRGGGISAVDGTRSPIRTAATSDP
jgi:hypothetical protein